MTQLREVIVNGLRMDLGQCQLDKMFMMITIVIMIVLSDEAQLFF